MGAVDPNRSLRQSAKFQVTLTHLKLDPEAESSWAAAAAVSGQFEWRLVRRTGVIVFAILVGRRRLGGVVTPRCARLVRQFLPVHHGLAAPRL
jgi:hypothetical protein